MTKSQQAQIQWRDGCVPVSTRFNDPYYSLENGLDETRRVFLRGNDLPGRFRPGFHIAELGFGTGLNMLAALLEWLHAGQAGLLHYTSFEAFPMAADDMRRALGEFRELDPVAPALLSAWSEGQTRIETDGLIADIIVGDAGEALSRWQGRADAWFLDGFAPSRNPEMWTRELMDLVAGHTAPGGTFATYTAAGDVRRALQSAGFSVDRRPGYGRKRHMTVGRLIT